ATRPSAKLDANTDAPHRLIRKPANGTALALCASVGPATAANAVLSACLMASVCHRSAPRRPGYVGVECFNRCPPSPGARSHLAGANVDGKSAGGIADAASMRVRNH